MFGTFPFRVVASWHGRRGVGFVSEMLARCLDPFTQNLIVACLGGRIRVPDGVNIIARYHVAGDPGLPLDSSFRYIERVLVSTQPALSCSEFSSERNRARQSLSSTVLYKKQDNPKKGSCHRSELRIRFALRDSISIEWYFYQSILWHCFHDEELGA